MVLEAGAEGTRHKFNCFSLCKHPLRASCVVLWPNPEDAQRPLCLCPLICEVGVRAQPPWGFEDVL